MNDYSPTDPRRAEPMAFTIDDETGRMVSDECDTTATRQPDGRWTVSGRDGTYSRNAAITALSLAEALAEGYAADHPMVQAWEAELREDRRG